MQVQVQGKKEEKSEEEGKKLLYEIVSMLIGLIKSKSNRIYQNNIDYNSASESV